MTINDNPIKTIVPTAGPGAAACSPTCDVEQPNVRPDLEAIRMEVEAAIHGYSKGMDISVVSREAAAKIGAMVAPAAFRSAVLEFDLLDAPVLGEPDGGASDTAEFTADPDLVRES